VSPPKRSRRRASPEISQAITTRAAPRPAGFGENDHDARRLYRPRRPRTRRVGARGRGQPGGAGGGGDRTYRAPQSDPQRRGGAPGSAACRSSTRISASRRPASP
jgi:hypothetical protein